MLVTITNVTSPAETLHIPSLGTRQLAYGDTHEVQRSFADLDGDNSLKQHIIDGKVSLSFAAEAIDDAQMAFGHPLVSYTNALRPAATAVPVLSSIWNTDDGFVNWSDGTNWLDPAGVIT